MINEEKAFSTNSSESINLAKSFSLPKTIALVTAGVLAVLAIGYGGMTVYLKDKFYFGTEINGVNCSGKNIEQAHSLLKEKANNYALIIQERENKTEQISANEIKLSIDVNDKLKEVKASQKPLKWGLSIIKKTKIDTAVNVSFDSEMLNEKFNSLECLSADKMIAPVNARVEYNQNNNRFEIVKEENGTTLKIEEVKTAIIESLNKFESTINLEEKLLYQNAEITSENESLKTNLDVMNQYALVTITYNFGEDTEIVDQEKIKDWLIISDEGEVEFDKAKVDAFVQTLARKYNSMGKTRSFKTSYNSHIVTVAGGDYGWWLNKAAESDTLIEAIKAGKDIVKEPVYLQKAAQYGANDIGNTYAEVNLGTQHMFFYKDGQKVFESDFVSGKPSNGHATPTGTYSVTYKELDATLKGENYRTPVKYWMPFNMDVGFHDAKWQSSFGGKRYLTHGSHGCINLPVESAKTLYSYIAKGQPVVVYNYVPTAEDLTTTQATTEKTTELTTAQVTTKKVTTTTAQTTTQATTQKPAEVTTKKKAQETTNNASSNGVTIILDDVSPKLPELN